MVNYQEYPCDLCSSQEAIEVPNAREYTENQPIHICQKCGFVHVKKRRSSEDVADDWSDNIFGSGYTAAIPAIKARLTFVTEFINAHLPVKGKSIFDVGAGEGVFLDMIRQESYEAKVFGIEPSSSNCKLMTDMGIDNFAGTVEQFHKNHSDKKADIVTIMWTLENCNSCRKMLDCSYDLLNEDGHIVLATGSRILVPFKKPLNYYFGPGAQDTHCFRFSANALQGLLAVSGFEMIAVNRYIDNDILCMIGKKTDKSKEIAWQKDNYLDVYDFFKRWHIETKMYYTEEQSQ